MNGGGAAPPPVASNGADEDEDADLLTIAEAKRRLARTLGVPESSIKIMAEA